MSWGLCRRFWRGLPRIFAAFAPRDSLLNSLTKSIRVTRVPARTAVPKDLEYSEPAQNTAAELLAHALQSAI